MPLVIIFTWVAVFALLRLLRLWLVGARPLSLRLWCIRVTGGIAVVKTWRLPALVIAHRRLMVAANWNLCGVIFAWTTLRFLLSFRRLLFYRRALSRLALSRLVLCLLLPGFWFRVFRLRVLRLSHSKGRLRGGFGVVLWFRHRKRWLLRFCWLKAFFGPVTGVLAEVKANLWLIGGRFLRMLVSIRFIAGHFCSFLQGARGGAPLAGC